MPLPSPLSDLRRSSRVRTLVGLALLTVVVVVLLGRISGASARPLLPTATERVAAVASETETSATVPKLSAGQAIVLGVVEGVTEFLPVSSTGHLTVAERLMGIGVDSDSQEVKDAANAYAVVIQAGAILAVVVLYWRRLLSMGNGVIGRDPEGRHLLIVIVVAFLPAAVFGVLLEKTIKNHLFGPVPIVVAWIIGGVALLVLSSSGWWEREKHGIGLSAMTARDGILIGLAQCIALWPGTSRSLVTIVAALLVGLSLASAVEFSFLLGLLTLGAATALDFVKDGNKIVSQFGVFTPLLGFVVAFVAAVIAVRWMVSYLQNHSLAIFGWYRLGIAALTIGLIAVGRI